MPLDPLPHPKKRLIPMREFRLLLINDFRVKAHFFVVNHLARGRESSTPTALRVKI